MEKVAAFGMLSSVVNSAAERLHMYFTEVVLLVYHRRGIQLVFNLIALVQGMPFVRPKAEWMEFILHPSIQLP